MTYGKILTKEQSFIITITAVPLASKLPSEIDFPMSPQTNDF